MSEPIDTFMYDYLKEDYDRETERFARFRDRVSFVSGFILLLGSGIATLLSSYVVDLKFPGLRDEIFVIGMVASLSFYALTLYFLWQAAIPIKFGNVASAEQLWDNYSKWTKYIEKNNPSPKPDLEHKFRNNICSAFAKAASSNRINTVQRSEQLVLALRTALISGIFLVAPAVCKVLKIYDQPELGPTKVEMVNPVKITVP